MITINSQKSSKSDAYSFQWIPFYEEFARKLLKYRDKRSELLDFIYNKDKIASNFTTYLHDSDNEPMSDIDPFTVIGIFNRGIKEESRTDIAAAFKDFLQIEADAPVVFDGIPILNNQKSHFFGFKEKRQSGDIDNLWQLFDTALNRPDRMENIFNIVRGQFIININLTMGLFWMLPDKFLALDSLNRNYLRNFGINLSGSLPEYRNYVDVLSEIRHKMETGEMPAESFPELSYKAYMAAQTQEGSDVVEPASEMHKYTKTDFLNEVFMSAEEYDELATLLTNKKNIILQGAPGVGKTFCAKRLAYSMMGEKDESRIEMIQFHQNYSYEDFIMGYKPAGGSFELKNGIFYDFCTKAAENPDKDYFFIIDEINRGNLSKIFGELLMLVEKDYRNEKIKLAYTDEKFSVPENIYLIGMMNTADRSLAMIDYALRRRFSFFNMKPGFGSDGFGKYRQNIGNPHFDKLIDKVIDLNKEIAKDDSLGSGFEIGHSYFCGREDLRGEEKEIDGWLKSVINYDIVPMLDEYWFDNKPKAEMWADELNAIFHD